jgi:hypothetical protein
MLVVIHTAALVTVSQVSILILLNLARILITYNNNEIIELSPEHQTKEIKTENHFCFASPIISLTRITKMEV